MADTTSANANQQHAGRYPAVHPAAVHFPIALFLLSAVFLLLWFWRDTVFLLKASYWTFMFATLGAVIAGGSGFFDYYNAPYPEHPAEGAAKTAPLHIRTGVVMIIIAVVSAVCFWVKNPVNDVSLVKWFAIIVFLEAILVVIQGFLGGRLVYTHHYGIEPRKGE